MTTTDPAVADTGEGGDEATPGEGTPLPGEVRRGYSPHCPRRRYATRRHTPEHDRKHAASMIPVTSMPSSYSDRLRTVPAPGLSGTSKFTLREHKFASLFASPAATMRAMHYY